MVTLMPRRKLNRHLAHSYGVRITVIKFAESKGEIAKARLLAHRDTGNAKVEVTHGKTDSLISLVDPNGNAKAIEFGHKWELPGGRRGYTQGLKIITTAVFGG